MNETDIYSETRKGEQPVRRGRWEIVHGVFTPGGDPWLICPFCHSEDSGHLGGIEMPQRWNFCPVCGADMREGNDAG